MIKKKDPNSFTNYFSLYNGTPGKTGVSPIGYLIAEYNVVRYDDVQAQNVGSIAKSTKRKFMLHCTQRIVIYNSASIHPEPDANSYNDYPALITTYLSLSDSTNSGLSCKVLDYAPKTVNTKIQTAGSTGNSSGSTQGTSKSSTVGSSTSETNSYGTSVTVGATDMGDFVALSGSVTASFDQSFTASHEQSSTSGTDSSTSRGQDSSSSASMSIKDWGAYGIVNPSNQQPNWVFGQEYPWDTIECRKEASGSPSNGKVQLIIPTEMLARLYDGTCLYPPSQLSLFGVNFVMKALWLVELDDTASDDIEITHNIFYSTASHSLNEQKVQVCIDQQPIELQCGTSEGDLSVRAFAKEKKRLQSG